MSRPIKIVDTATGLVLFDGLQAVTWKVLMKQSVPASGVRLKNISPGQIYTFIFQQDADGGHSFTWPVARVRNGTRLDLRPLAVSVQNYIGSTGGILLSDLPGTGGAST
jgi:hypothetical protein